MLGSLIAHFGPIYEVLPTFPSQPLNVRRPNCWIARTYISRAYKKQIINK